MSSVMNQLYFGTPEHILERLDGGDCGDNNDLLVAAVAGLARNLVRVDKERPPRRQFGDRNAMGILVMIVEGLAHARAEVQAQRWTLGQRDAFINGLELTARKFLEAQ